LGAVEALGAQPHGDRERALAVVAEDDDVGVGVELGVGAGGDVAHGHKERIGKACGVELPGLADVEEGGRVWGLRAELDEGLGRDLGVEGIGGLIGHGVRISPGRCV
jgi:hypothetical protein